MVRLSDVLPPRSDTDDRNELLAFVLRLHWQWMSEERSLPLDRVTIAEWLRFYSDGVTRRFMVRLMDEQNDFARMQRATGQTFPRNARPPVYDLALDEGLDPEYWDGLWTGVDEDLHESEAIL